MRGRKDMKTVLLQLVLLMSLLATALCVSACGREMAAEDPGLIRVGFSQVGSESNWRMANTASMTAALSEEEGFELLFDNAKQRQENQLLAIRNFIQQDVDYIVLAPIAEAGWDDVLHEARDAGIPVIIVDRRIDVGDRDLYVSWVGSDFLREGERAVAWLEKELDRRGDAGKPLRILHIRGTDGATSQLMRTRALEEAVEAHPEWEIAASLPGEYTEAKSYELVRDYLRTDRDIDVVYSENDNMSFGAIRALEESGLSCGKDGDVMILSFDAVREALRLCMEGKINACAECNPLHGPRVAALIRQLESGEIPEKETYVEEMFFDTDMLTEELILWREY